MSAAQPRTAEPSELVSSLAPRVARPQVRLQARGPVLPGALYVSRPVDAALLASLRRGESTVVLGPAGSGKSSLLSRTAAALAERGRCVQLDLGALGGSTSTAVQHELLSAAARALAVPLAPFLARTEGLGPGERLTRLLVDEAESTLFLFLDGMESLPELPLDGATVLTGLLAAREERAAGTAPLVLCLLSACPVERWAATVPPEFLALPTLRLLDLTRRELGAFVPALQTLLFEDGSPAAASPETGGATRDPAPAPAADPSAIWLDAIFELTAGHPQLVQRLVQQLVARASSPLAPSDVPAFVERVARALFVDAELVEIAEVPGLAAAAKAVTTSPAAAALLGLYKRLLAGAMVVPDVGDPLQRELWLCGLCAEVSDAVGAPRLRPRCRLFTLRLDDEWVRGQEVRHWLAAAAAGQALRGVQLKTASVWARRAPAALTPEEIAVLLASLEAALRDAETRHQASAAALQRELRAKTRDEVPGEETPPARLLQNPARPGLGSGPRSSPIPPRQERALLWAIAGTAALALLLMLLFAGLWLRARASGRAADIQKTPPQTRAASGRSSP